MLTILLLGALFQLSYSLDPIPKPFYTLKGSKVFGIAQDLDISNIYPKCNILNDAVKRINKYLFNTIYLDYRGPVSEVISSVQIYIKAGCFEDSSTLLWPSENMNETYQITVTNEGIYMVSEEIWGTLRALETLFQLAYRNYEGRLCINETVIYDFPRFTFRGFMLDTSRHFIPTAQILQTLEAMSISKLNVFHWHIVDDESFPYQSRTFPKLSRQGSYHQYTEVYTQRDILHILDFARRRGIRVIPEFDSPGHSLSWGKGQPNLLTPCYSGSKPNGYYGPIDPTVISTFNFLESLFQELDDVFPDNYVHLGGDEVDFNCWKSNPYIVNFTKKNGFPNDFAKLQGYYMVKLINMIKGLKTKKSSIKTLVWQEVFDNKNEVDRNSTLIHVWKGEENWQQEMSDVTNNNYKAVLSSCWYLNYIHYGLDWKAYYKCDPQNFKGQNKHLVIGGEACMWAEYIDKANVISLSWPRASVVAERLWSPNTTVDITDFASRLEPFRCRLIINGINAETSDGGGSYCNQPGNV